MGEQFLKVMNLSLSAGYLVLAVVILRFLLKGAPKWTRTLLWGLVALRLLFPFSVESVLSLLPSAQVIPTDIAHYQTPVIDTGFQAVDRVVNPVIIENFTPAPGASANPLQIWLEIGGWVWAVGAAVMLTYTLVSYLSLRRRVRGAGRVEKNVYRSRAVDTPFVLGLFRPRICLPSSLSEEDAVYVVAHEKAHIRRGDHIWKPLGFLLLSIHWFNPLMWGAYILLCRDIELACDEKVIRSLGREDRADYSQALLHCSVSRRTIAACPLAFGEVGVKQRVKSVLSYKKPGFWILAAAVTAAAVLAVCFLTDPKTPDKPMTLADVQQLAKGDGPGWSDFDGFAYEAVDETTRRYALEGVDFTLTVKVPYPDAPPRSVILSCNLERGTGLDIRRGGLDEYLAIHIQRQDILAGNHWGADIGWESVTPTGGLFYLARGNGAEEIDFFFTEAYFIQVKTGAGWQDLPTLREPGWSDEQFELGYMDTRELNWEDLYGPLPDGEYRLCRELLARVPGAERPEQFTAYTEFGLCIQGREILTAETLLKILDDGAYLNWEDFEGYAHSTHSRSAGIADNLRYTQHYDIPGPLRLVLQGPSREEALHRLFMNCAFDEEFQMLYPNMVTRDLKNAGEETKKAAIQQEAVGLQSFIKLHNRPIADENTNHWGITFALERAGATEATVYFDYDPDLIGDSLVQLSDQYVLYELTGGVWQRMPVLRGQEWGEEHFQTTQPGSMTINWQDRYGVLPEGRYKLEMNINAQLISAGSVWGPSSGISVEFTVDPPR